MNKNPNSEYKIRFKDCDLFGHLNNSSYLDYFINAREDHLKDHYSLNLTEYYKNDFAWLIGGHEIAYLRPAVYDEVVTIQSSLLYVDDNSLHIEILMMNQKQTHLKAIVRSKLIAVNTKTGRKEQHKPEFMQWAKTVENTEVGNQGTMQDRIKQLLSDFKAKQNT